MKRSFFKPCAAETAHGLTASCTALSLSVVADRTRIFAIVTRFSSMPSMPEGEKIMYKRGGEGEAASKRTQQWGREQEGCYSCGLASLVIVCVAQGPDAQVESDEVGHDEDDQEDQYTGHEMPAVPAGSLRCPPGRRV